MECSCKVRRNPTQTFLIYIKTGRFQHVQNILKYRFHNLIGMLAKRSDNSFLLAGLLVGAVANLLAYLLNMVFSCGRYRFDLNLSWVPIPFTTVSLLPLPI